jgi:dephospho-CoA kinase
VRIAAVGTSGAGKTTMAKALAADLALPRVELDALNWEADWRDLSQTNPDEFARRVTAARRRQRVGARRQLRHRTRSGLAPRDASDLARLRPPHHHVPGDPPIT